VTCLYFLFPDTKLGHWWLRSTGAGCEWYVPDEGLVRKAWVEGFVRSMTETSITRVYTLYITYPHSTLVHLSITISTPNLSNPSNEFPNYYLFCQDYHINQPEWVRVHALAVRLAAEAAVDVDAAAVA